MRGQKQRRWAAPSVRGGFSSSATYKPIKGAEGAVDQISKRTRAYVYKNAETDAPSAPFPAVVAVKSALSCGTSECEWGQLARPPPASSVPENVNNTRME
jgi:hypothetical protein